MTASNGKIGLCVPDTHIVIKRSVSWDLENSCNDDGSSDNSTITDNKANLIVQGAQVVSNYGLTCSQLTMGSVDPLSAAYEQDLTISPELRCTSGRDNSF